MGNQSCACLNKQEEGELNQIDSNPSVVRGANINPQGTNQSNVLNNENTNDFITKDTEALTQLFETFQSKYAEKLEIAKLTEHEYKDKLNDFPHIKSFLNSPEYSSFPQSQESNGDLILGPPLKLTNTLSNNTEYYKGQLNKNCEMSGEGELFTEDGNYYKGTFDNNLFNGKGIYINDKGNIYNGEWKDGKSNGEGEYTLVTGHKYKGGFKNNMKNGMGEETSPDGTKYIGEFVDNVKHGKGEIYFPDGDKYEGMFENDEITGEGVFTARDGRVSKGMFCNGKLNGNAITTFPDNSQYEGNYVNDLKSGSGTYRWNDGKELNVKWVKNVPEGKGKMNIGDKEMDVIYRFGKMIQCKESTS